MNITKLNRRKLYRNIIFYNVILFLIFASVSYIVYSYKLKSYVNVINAEQKICSAEIRESLIQSLKSGKSFKQFSVNDFGNKIIPHLRRTSFNGYLLTFDGRLLNFQRTDRYSTKIYKRICLDAALKKAIQGNRAFFQYKGNLLYNNTIVAGLDRKSPKLTFTIEYPKVGVDKIKDTLLRKMLYKTLALYIIIAYIMTMLIFIVSRLYYNRFQTRILGDLLRETSDGIIVTDVDCDIIFANQAFLKIFDVTLKEVTGQNIKKFKSSYHDKEFYEGMWGKIAREGYWEGEVVDVGPEDKKIFTKLKVTSIISKKDRKKYYIGVYEDKTKEEKA